MIKNNKTRIIGRNIHQKWTFYLKNRKNGAYYFNLVF